jgi:nicotinate-nucleotide pyrophosphorylase (carboxylating)
VENVYSRDFSDYEDKIRQRALQAFRDDLGEGDITTESVFGSEDPESKAVIIAEEDCILAGLLEARTIFEDAGLSVSGKEDGENAKDGEEILLIKGSLKQILSRERVALNYITRMSGIATLSRKLAEAHDKKVLFLRKTDPGLLFSEKRAVSLGGSYPHRMNLADGILIKDNHINELAKGSTRLEAIQKCISRAAEKYSPVEVEVETVEEAQYAAEEMLGLKGPNMILLDNMNLRQVKRASDLIKQTNAEIVIEASGGITEETIRDYLDAGADYVSTSLFVSAKPAKFKLELSR